jgi:homogentisate 1,2-dioxygenase
MATEMLGMIYGEYKGSVRELGPGHLSCENSYMPHGESYESWRFHTTRELKNEMVGEGTLQFMMHMSSHFSLTEFARKRHGDEKEQKTGEFWEVVPHFYDHLETINESLKAAGRPLLEVKTKGKPESVSSDEWQAVGKKVVTPAESE